MALLCRVRIFAPLLVTAVAIGLLHAAPAVAQSSIYTVRNVAVDVTGDNATQARSQALLDAYAKGFDSLVERLVPSGEQSYVPQLDGAQLEQLVRDFEVEEERTSAVRYIAELTVRFQPEGVKQVLRNAGVSYAVTRSKPLVVLPVYGSGGDARLWDEPNPWRAAWSRYPAESGLLPMLVPLGDLSDMAAVDAGQALSADRTAMRELAVNYGAEGAVVAQAQLSGDPQAGSARIDVSGRWFDLSGGGAGSQVARTLRQREGEDLDGLLYRGAQTIARTFNESWKSANLIDFGQRQALMAEVPIDSLQLWQGVRSRLLEVSTIESLNLLEFSRRFALVEVGYFGDVDQLGLALSQQNLSLSANPDLGIWRITARGYDGTGSGTPGSDGGGETTVIE